MDLLIFLEFFIALLFNPFWAGFLVGLFLGVVFVKKYKHSGNHKHYEWPAPKKYEGKIPGL